MEYKDHKVIEWLMLVRKGKIAFPDFQRDYVWKEKNIREFLESIFSNRPIGTLILMEANENLAQSEFEYRELKGISSPSKPESLVIDGQQRLTTLWNTLTNNGGKCYYVKTQGLFNKNKVVEKIKVPEEGNFIESEAKPSDSEQPNPGKVKKDIGKNRIPVALLLDLASGDGSNSKLDEWCHIACDEDEEQARILSQQIRSDLQMPIEEYRICGCFLPHGRDANEAVTIFVKTNESAVKIRDFDYMVAHMQLVHGQKLRKTIEKVHKKHSSEPLGKVYLKPNKEDWMKDLGEELLKIACLKMESPVSPTKEGYRKALEEMWEDGTGAKQNFEKKILDLGNDLVAALKLVEDAGVWTRSVLPSWVPIHVLAALQDQYESMKVQKQDAVRELFICYFWRAVFGDRYNKKANNDALLEDYIYLAEDLENIKCGSPVEKLRAPIFDDSVRIINKNDLMKPISWIKSGREGKGLVALVYGHQEETVPKDWITGSALSVAEVRRLEEKGKIHCHHVFPRDFLENSLSEPDKPKRQKLINHGLNGIVLPDKSNYALYKNDPAEYLQELCLEHGISNEDLSKRVNSHIVPYEGSLTDLKSFSSIDARYEAYLEERAEDVAHVIEERTSVTNLKLLKSATKHPKSTN